jgi:glutamyl-tRNA synthetase
MTHPAVKTRFAPSPTGSLHLGGARTALFAWLIARHYGGEFLLRVEDTDQVRSTPEAVEAILAGMAWLGLDYDQGPIFQTERLDRYRAVADQLLADGHAYRCACTPARLEALRADQLAKKRKPRYDGHCRDHGVASDVPHVVRLKTPQAGTMAFEDVVYGPMCVENNELDDLILLRSDGMPTYHFSVVIDDADMGITHVVRGADHLNSTPRHLHLYQALGLPAPIYAHVPMILGADGKKLSKRHGAMSVLAYRDQGYLPEAMLNYLARLGWSAGDQEIFSREALITQFDFQSIQKSPAAFSEDKLAWLNQHYLKTTVPTQGAALLQAHLVQHGVTTSDSEQVAAVFALQSARYKTLVEMAEASLYFFKAVTAYDPKAARKHLTEAAKPGLRQVREALSALTAWSEAEIHAVIISTAEALELKLGKLAQPIRVALTGNTVSPPLDVTLTLIGKAAVLAALDQALAYIDQRPAEVN